MARLRAFLIALAACCIALLAVELYLRLTQNHYLFLPKQLQPKYFVVPDPDAGYDLAPDFKPAPMYFIDGKFTLWSNELACFDEPFKGDKEYLLLAGDSGAWGFAPYQQKAGTVLEKLLHKRVVKAGVLGYGTRQELAKVKKLVAKIGHPPRAIILMYCASNDFIDDYLFPRYTVLEGYLVTHSNIISCVTGEKFTFPEKELAERAARFREYGSFFPPTQPPLVLWFRSHSVLFQRLVVNPNFRAVLRPFGLVRKEVIEQKVKGVSVEGGQLDVPDATRLQEYPEFAAAWQAHLQTLAEFKRTADSYGSRLIVVLLPSKETVYPCLPDPNGIGRKERNTLGALKEFLNAQGIETLDLVQAFQAYAQSHRGCNIGRDALFYHFDAHWSELGNKVTAQAIAAYMEKE